MREVFFLTRFLAVEPWETIPQQAEITEQTDMGNSDLCLFCYFRLLRYCLLQLHLFNLHAFPECNIVFDILRCLFRIGVIPGCIFVPFAVNDNVIIAGRAFPRTNSMGFAWLEELFPDHIRRKVVVPFDNNCIVAFGKNCAVPNRFHNCYYLQFVLIIVSKFSDSPDWPHLPALFLVSKVETLHQTIL